MDKKIKRLPETYRANGMTWKILERTTGNDRDKAISERINAPASYEVFYIKRRKPVEYFKEDMTLEFIETVPENEDFGDIGWAYTNKQRAYETYARL